MVQFAEKLPKLSQADAGRKVQAKFVVDAPGDACEQEADRIAAMAATRLPGSGAALFPEEKPGCPGVRRRPERARPLGSPDPAGCDATRSAVEAALQSPARPLDPEARAYMEPRFGHDFSQVRIHADSAAADSATALAARAYTLGADIVFAEGQYRPGNPDGRRLLAHELAHVVQQGAARPAGNARQPVLRAAGADLIQRAGDVELNPTTDAEKIKTCQAKAEAAIQELEKTAALPNYPLPDYIKNAITLLRERMKAGKIKCYAFSGITHGAFKGDEIRIDGINQDMINVTTLLHEGVHAAHKKAFPAAGKKYEESLDKELQSNDPKLPDLLRWKAYTEYWAYRARFDYFNPSRSPAYTEEEIHKAVLKDDGVKREMARLRPFDATFDPRVWKPKG